MKSYRLTCIVYLIRSTSLYGGALFNNSASITKRQSSAIIYTSKKIQSYGSYNKYTWTLRLESKKKMLYTPWSTGCNVDLNEHALKAIDEKQRIKASITLKWCNSIRFVKLKEGKKYTPHFFRVSAVRVINTFSFKREESLLPSRNILSCYDLDGYRRLTSADSG